MRFTQMVDIGELPSEAQRTAAYNILRRYHPELVTEIRTAIEGGPDDFEREAVACLLVGAVLHVHDMSGREDDVPTLREGIDLAHSNELQAAAERRR